MSKEAGDGRRQNLLACAANVLAAWDNQSPGPEKWTRLRERIEALRGALSDDHEGPELDHDDRARLNGIAAGIELAIEEGTLRADYAGRDARFLRRLASRDHEGPQCGGSGEKPNGLSLKEATAIVLGRPSSECGESGEDGRYTLARFKAALAEDELVDEVADAWTEGEEGLHPDFVRSLLASVFDTIALEVQLAATQHPACSESGEGEGHG